MTKKHSIKPKITKDVKKKIESFKKIDLYKWHEDEDEESVYWKFTKTINTFRNDYQPWFSIWRLLGKPWDKVEKRELSLQRIFEIESDALGIDIRTLG